MPRLPRLPKLPSACATKSHELAARITWSGHVGLVRRIPMAESHSAEPFIVVGKIKESRASVALSRANEPNLEPCMHGNYRLLISK